MSKSKALPLTLRALSQWPIDPLRPKVQFKDVMIKRANQRASNPQTNEGFELDQANALFSLLENRYSNKYQIPQSLTKPASNPKYYENLMNELKAAPNRTLLGGWLNKWKGFLRFS